MAERVTLATIAGVFQKQLKALRPGVADVAKALDAARTKSKDLAPKVIGLFNKLKAEYAGLSFVDFARMFDPTVPEQARDLDGAPGYRTHRTYYALDYMRRLTNAAPRGRQGARDSATDALARTLATVLQVVADADPIWEAVQKEFAFGERVMVRLKKRVEDTKPLIKLEGRPVKAGNVIHMERAKPVEGEGGEGQAAGGRGRKVA